MFYLRMTELCDLSGIDSYGFFLMNYEANSWVVRNSRAVLFYRYYGLGHHARAV